MKRRLRTSLKRSAVNSIIFLSDQVRERGTSAATHRNLRRHVRSCSLRPSYGGRSGVERLPPGSNLLRPGFHAATQTQEEDQLPVPPPGDAGAGYGRFAEDV